MTGRHSPPRRRPWARLRPGLDLASVPGRARADAWPLALMTLVLALGVGLAALTPRLVARTERDAVETAVAAAGERATVVVSHGLDEPWDDNGGRDDIVDQIVRLADLLDDSVAQTLPGIDPQGMRALLSRSLPLTDVTDPRGETTVRFAHVWRAGGPALTWVDGRAPAAAPEPEPGDGPPVRVVEVGLSAEVAAFLQVGPGDTLPSPWVSDGPSELRVAGVFRADDPTDPVWAALPALLAPAARGDEVVLNTAVGMLSTDDAFPDLFAALPPGSFTASYTYRADPVAVADAGADVVARETGAAVANPMTLSTAMWSEVRSDLPEVLGVVLDQVRAARVQGGVLVGAVGGGVVLTLVLAAALLTTRRAQVLAQHRARGGSLGAVLVELLAEAVPVAAVGTALGLVVAGALAPGPVPWLTVGPLAGAALVAPPALGVRSAALAVGGRRPAAGRRRAGREAAREGAREKAVRRLVLEAAAVLAAAGAVATANARDVAAGGLALVAAPVLVAVAAALVLVRAVPLLLGVGLALARRSRHAVPVLAAGRARAATRPLALIALTAVVALAGFAAAVAATIETGREQASWDAVGADVTAVTRPDDAVAEAAARLAAAPGVDLATALHVEQLSFRSTWGAVDAHVVAVDADDFAELARLTPVGGPDAVRRAGLLRGAAPDGVPALVSADLLEHSDEGLGISWFGSWVPVTAVGPAPAVDGRRSGLVVVDLATFDEAVASAVPPNAVWAVGPGAEDAVRAAPELRDAEVTSRAAWLEARRSDPLTGTVTAATLVGAGLLAVLGALVVVLSAAGGATDRGRTLATLRAVGVTARQSWRIALGELAPPVLVASAFGVAAGIGIARLLGGALDLRLLTGQAAEPVVVAPWWAVVPVPLLVVVAVVVISVEASTRRRERLGQVLRIGTAR
ncbi:ABC transporter permease [Actinotalea fermentans]|uniref:ABC3 transporter permease C-terminal domain-containing protein n=1 Tax=Actinotalea fermentans TaxID=43671 RepID=A0A511YWH2_9CELL|nr:ABC transporter permease [Actinotalea fermentans]GEN79532.1 hypothetical protein AFE02nite_12660 [Actinotalea fermentans]